MAQQEEPHARLNKVLVKLEYPQEGIVQMSLCRGAGDEHVGQWEMLDA